MRIKKIEIKNFKFFGEKFELDVNCKNLLIYGENGSGKSSLYWALYTFFQSSIKEDNEIQKYFDKNNTQNLLNLDKQDDDSYIYLSLVEDNTTEDYKISINKFDANKYNKIKIANQSSDFISYRLTSRIYDFKNNERIDLFSIFEKDIIDFMIVDGVNLSNEWKIIKKGLEKVKYDKKTIHPGKNTIQYKEFKGKIESFNDKFRYEINSIIRLTNDILKNKFNTDFEILLNYENCFYDDDEKKIINPKIILETLYNNKKIDKPHIFLNEAKLTTIALAIRFALLEKRLVKSELKILVLDDLLISLDMSNRMKVIDIILNDYVNDYQLIILTHDKSFFRTIERKIKAKEDWKFYEFKTKENKLDFTEYKEDIEKAKECFKNKNFEQSALYLRKHIEETLKNFLNKEPTKTIKQEFESLEHLIIETEKEIKNYLLIRLLNPYQKIFDKNISKQVAEIFIDSINSITFDEYSDNKQIKGYLLSLHSRLLDFLEELYDENSFVIEIKDELKELKDRVLNPSAHNSDEPLFEEEVNDAINTIDKITKSLKKIKENKEKQKSVQNINKKTEHKTEIKIKDNIENKVIIDFENDFTKKIILLTDKNDLNNFLINNVYENIILFTEKETEEFLNQLLIKANLLDDSSFVNLTHIVDKITKNKQLTTNIKLIFGKFAYEITNITKEINKKSFVNILFNYGCVVNHNCLFNKYYTILFDGIINQTIEMDIDDILFNQFIEILNNNEERHGNLVDYKIINKSFELILRKLKTNDKHFIDDISVFETLRKNNLHIVLNEFIRKIEKEWLDNNAEFIVQYLKNNRSDNELLDVIMYLFYTKDYSLILLKRLYNYFENSDYDYYNDDNPKYKELMDFVKNKFEEDIPF